MQRRFIYLTAVLAGVLTVFINAPQAEAKIEMLTRIDAEGRVEAVPFDELDEDASERTAARKGRSANPDNRELF